MWGTHDRGARGREGKEETEGGEREERPQEVKPEEGDADISTNWDEVTPSFDAMDLKEDLLRGIYAHGFEKPSAIQQRAIKPMLMGRDVIAQAQSGM